MTRPGLFAWHKTLAHRRTQSAASNRSRSKAAQTNSQQAVPQSLLSGALGSAAKRCLARIAPFAMAAMPAVVRTGPDLMDSDLVASDVRGQQDRTLSCATDAPKTACPRSNFPRRRLSELAAFLHAQKTEIRIAARRTARRVGQRSSDRQRRGGQTIFQWRRDLLDLPFPDWRSGRRGQALSRAGT